LVLTDSAGIAEETTALGVPCLTLRENTERPVTITEGSNQLVGCDSERIVAAATAILKIDGKTDYSVPQMWDGQSAQRLVAVLRQGIARR
jgi:UDP-N-acetylglucosamine 2-epimerase (non-hydrolysing)